MKSPYMLLIPLLLCTLVGLTGCKAKPEKKLAGAWRIDIEQTAEHLDSDSEFLYGLTVAGLAMMNMAMRFDKHNVELMFSILGEGEYDAATFEITDVNDQYITLEIQADPNAEVHTLFEGGEQFDILVRDADHLSITLDDESEDGGVVFRRIEDEEFQKLVDKVKR